MLMVRDVVDKDGFHPVPKGAKICDLPVRTSGLNQKERKAEAEQAEWLAARAQAEAEVDAKHAKGAKKRDKKKEKRKAAIEAERWLEDQHG